MNVIAGYFVLFSTLKLKTVFISLFLLSQGIMGPVPADYIPSAKDVNQFHSQYYQPELAKSLSEDAYFYCFFDRLDIGSQNFIKTDFGKELIKLPIPKTINTLVDDENPIQKVKQYLQYELNLPAQDIYALFQSKFEIAIPSYSSTLQVDDLLIAIYPKSSYSHMGYNNLISSLETKVLKNFHKEEDNNYTLWNFPTENGQNFYVAHIKNRSNSFYIISFSQDTIKTFLNTYQDYGSNSLYNKLQKTGTIKRMGRGTYFGFYFSLKKVIKDTKSLVNMFGEEIIKAYDLIGIESMVYSYSYQNKLYHDRTVLSYDPEQESIFKKLSSVPLVKEDFKWVPYDTRFFYALSLKELPKTMDLLGDIVLALGDQDDYEDYKRGMNEIKEETNIDLYELFSQFSGKIMIAFNGPKSFFEETFTSLNNFGDYFAYHLLKRMMVSIDINDQKQTTKLIKSIIDVMETNLKTPIQDRSYLDHPYHKQMVKLKHERSPISIYWSYNDNRLLIAFTEINMKKMIHTIKGGGYHFYRRIRLKTPTRQTVTYEWVDYSFVIKQLTAIYEAIITDFNQENFDEYKGGFQFQEIIPLLHKASYKAGKGWSTNRLTSYGIVNDSYSHSGFSMSNFVSPMTLSWFFGMTMMRMPLSEKKAEAVKVQPEPIEESTSSEPHYPDGEKVEEAVPQTNSSENTKTDEEKNYPEEIPYNK